MGSVAITDKEKILAFVGQGSDHHIPGNHHRIAFYLTPPSPKTRSSSRPEDRSGIPARCRPTCPLTSVLVVPLHIDNDVIGTIQLFEPKNKRFLNMNKTLGEGIARLLSNQLLLARYEMQKNLLVSPS